MPLHALVLFVVILHASRGEPTGLQTGSFRLAFNMHLEPFLELSGLGAPVQLHGDVRIAFFVFSSK